MIDVSYRYKQSVLKGGKMLMDPETGVIALVGAEEEPEQQPVPEPEPVKPATRPTPRPKGHGKA